MFEHEMRNIHHKLSGFQMDMDSVKDQEIDESIVSFYRERFKMFAEDGCRGAIDVYLNHMLEDDSINTLTRIAIGTEALKF